MNGYSCKLGKDGVPVNTRSQKIHPSPTLFTHVFNFTATLGGTPLNDKVGVRYSDCSISKLRLLISRASPWLRSLTHDGEIFAA
jgi:hypothetical protein